MRLTAIATLFLAFGIFAPGTSRLATAAPVDAASTCQNYQLLIRPHSSQGAAGSDAVIFQIHNLTSHPCSLTGYPGIELLSRQFASLPTTVHRGRGDLVGAIPVRTVTLAPNANAYFAMGYSDVIVNNQPCPKDYYVMIFAPNDYLPVVAYPFPGPGHTITACSGTLYVSPVTPKPRYQ